MQNHCLEVTYRKGVPIAAYYYLERRPGDAVQRTVRLPVGLLIDYTADDRAIGVEITVPQQLSLQALNEALIASNQSPVEAAELAPLLAA